MRTVNIGELKNSLSGYLQYVKNGEESVVWDRSLFVAHILPFRHDAGWEWEAQMVVSGALKMPEEAMDWEQFFRAPAGGVPQELAVEAALSGRRDR